MHIKVLFCALIFIACANQSQSLPAIKKYLDSTENNEAATPNLDLEERISVLLNGLKPTGLSVGNYGHRTRSEKQRVHNIRKRGTRHSGRRFRAFLGPEVAFQSTLTKLTETVELKDPIKFNYVITNIGKAYDSNTGIFTAPFSGLYNFNTNIVAEKGHYVEASIVVNGEATVSAISDHRLLPQDLWDQGNAVALLSLHRGDKVAVSILWPIGTHTIHGAGKSSFSGYLLRSHEHYLRLR